MEAAEWRVELCLSQTYLYAIWNQCNPLLHWFQIFWDFCWWNKNHRPWNQTGSHRREAGNFEVDIILVAEIVIDDDEPLIIRHWKGVQLNVKVAILGSFLPRLNVKVAKLGSFLPHRTFQPPQCENSFTWLLFSQHPTFHSH